MVTPDRTENRPQTLNFEQLVAMAPEYDRWSRDDAASARDMVVRMFYFVQVISPNPNYDPTLMNIGVAVVTGNYDEAIALSQKAYLERYLTSHPESPETILGKLMPTAAASNLVPGGRRLKSLKSHLREIKPPARPQPEEVAERRLLRRKAWEVQLTRINAKLERGALWPKKETRLKMDKYKLEDLLLRLL